MWGELTERERSLLSASAARRRAEAGTVIHGGGADCTGLLLVASGRLRAYMLSDEGREITLYRLFEGDVCLLSAACALSGLQLEVTVEAERDTEFFVIPADVYRRAMAESAPLANFTNALMAARFSEVMWLMDQVMNKRLDERLAAFLLEEAELRGAKSLAITHEQIANHMGTQREVITRMLRHFQQEGLVVLSRGRVELANEAGLQALAAEARR